MWLIAGLEPATGGLPNLRDNTHVFIKQGTKSCNRAISK